MYQRKKFSLNIIQYMQAKVNFIQRIHLNQHCIPEPISIIRW